MICCKKLFKGKMKPKTIKEIRSSLILFRTTMRQVLMFLGFVWIVQNLLLR